LRRGPRPPSASLAGQGPNPALRGPGSWGRKLQINARLQRHGPAAPRRSRPARLLRTSCGGCEATPQAPVHRGGRGLDRAVAPAAAARSPDQPPSAPSVAVGKQRAARTDRAAMAPAAASAPSGMKALLPAGPRMRWPTSAAPAAPAAGRERRLRLLEATTRRSSSGPVMLYECWPPPWWRRAGAPPARRPRAGLKRGSTPSAGRPTTKSRSSSTALHQRRAGEASKTVRSGRRGRAHLQQPTRPAAGRAGGHRMRRSTGAISLSQLLAEALGGSVAAKVIGSGRANTSRVPPGRSRPLIPSRQTKRTLRARWQGHQGEHPLRGSRCRAGNGASQQAQARAAGARIGAGPRAATPQPSAPQRRRPLTPPQQRPGLRPPIDGSPQRTGPAPRQPAASRGCATGRRARCSATARNRRRFFDLCGVSAPMEWSDLLLF